ncbi:S8 family serine peptidase [Chromatiaceae bacterium AAb-1]|nr:S8 family serine peptidase [Chromatiaceae bacterium AAb-1]
MRFNRFTSRTVLAAAVSAVCYTAAVAANGYEVSVDTSLLTSSEPAQASAPYIVQVKGVTGIEKAAELGELQPARQLVRRTLNQYNAASPQVAAYTQRLKQFHNELAAQAAGSVLHSYTHTFNGFSAKLTAAQAEKLKRHPDVVGVWQDKPEQITTANTPEFLGLNGPDGQHTLGIKGEDVVIGIVDTGIWPEHPSFADDGSYTPLEGWNGSCDVGEDENFVCNNKLIGARYYKNTFESVYALQPGEFVSPRDADNHGSHVAGTAGGNEGVTALLNDTPIATVTGIAPRARIAMYKACWNSDYVSPAGVAERGCFYGDTMAAIDQAVADGVDVINYSIGGSLTDLTTVSAAAKLRAAQAGVFVAVSVGNSGPAAQTIGTPAPWVTGVAASTYTGESVVNGIEVSSESVSGTFAAVEGAQSRPLRETGDLTAELAVTVPLDGCSALANAAEIAGRIALVQRGTCPFDDKLINAQNAGAVGVVVFNNDGTAPFIMGGSVTTLTIPSVMVSLANGNLLAAAVGNDETVEVTLSPSVFAAQQEVGNLMATFSSKGPNIASYDVIKPDITAPGVRILAAASSQPMLRPHGNSFTYLQGTSMSSPHIAGMAALLKDAHPDWSPAMIKSALMTTARQDVLKETGIGAADPFDFGAGHAVPASATNPGLTYDISSAEYFAFLCGLEEYAFVQNASGFSCTAFEDAGYQTDPSQLNLPSIGIAELSDPETIYREVTDVSGNTSTYTATIAAPAGVNVTVQTQDGSGNWVDSDSLTVTAGGKALYALRFTPNSSAVYQQWAFGSVSWSDGVHTVRSPIAVRVVPTQTIDAPATITAEVPAAAGRVSLPVLMKYTGNTSTRLAGLSAPFGSSRTIPQDPDRSFSFNEAGLGTHMLEIPAGTRVARFSLYEELANVAGADLDLYVYRCENWLCSQIAISATDGGYEDIILRDPQPAADGDNGTLYIVWVHAYDLRGAATVNYTMPFWIVDAEEGNATVTASSRAINGRYNNVTVLTKNLTASPFPYLGVLSFLDDEDTEQDSTLLQIYAQ